MGSNRDPLAYALLAVAFALLAVAFGLIARLELVRP